MVLLDHCPEPVSYESTNKILEQMKSYICKIMPQKDKNIFDTGFFCFINYKNKKMPVMITNNHVMDQNLLNNEKISIEVNNVEKDIYLKDRKKYTNMKCDATIIEIYPKKDGIYHFLELDENIFLNDDIEVKYKNLAIYILQKDRKGTSTTYGTIKNIIKDISQINYFCSTYTAGAPIMNLNNHKIIGIHAGSKIDKKYNVGYLLKDAINEYINKYKDYIEKSIESPQTFSFENNENKIKEETNINNFSKVRNELENALKKEKEKNIELEEQIKTLKNLLNNNNNTINEYKDTNKVNRDDLMESVLKKDKEIEDLKAKLGRFPFQLLEGEKLMSIIIISIDQKIHCSFICKNTDVFSSIETKLYQMYNEYSESENFFTVNGKKINRHKNLDYNHIKDKDIIILNVLED